MRLISSLAFVAALAFSGCSSSGEAPTSVIYVDTVIPREKNRIRVAPGETTTLGRVIDAIGGFDPAEKNGYVQILCDGRPPVVFKVIDIDRHRDFPLVAGDSVYIGLKAR